MVIKNCILSNIFIRYLSLTCVIFCTNRGSLKKRERKRSARPRPFQVGIVIGWLTVSIILNIYIIRTEDFTNLSIIKQTDIETFVGLPYSTSLQFHTISFVICGCNANKIYISRTFLYYDNILLLYDLWWPTLNDQLSWLGFFHLHRADVFSSEMYYAYPCNLILYSVFVKNLNNHQVQTRFT